MDGTVPSTALEGRGCNGLEHLPNGGGKQQLQVLPGYLGAILVKVFKQKEFFESNCAHQKGFFPADKKLAATGRRDISFLIQAWMQSLLKLRVTSHTLQCSVCLTASIDLAVEHVGRRAPSPVLVESVSSMYRGRHTARPYHRHTTRLCHLCCYSMQEVGCKSASCSCFAAPAS